MIGDSLQYWTPLRTPVRYILIGGGKAECGRPNENGTYFVEDSELSQQVHSG